VADEASSLRAFLYDAELCEALDISLATLKRRINPRAYTFPLQPLPAIDKRRRWSRIEVEKYLAGETRAALAMSRRRAS
jgi:hypothetical protein